MKPKLVFESSSLAEQLVSEDFPPEAEAQREPPPRAGEQRERPEENKAAEPWPELHDKALHGLAGEIINTIKPQTEADPVAILLQFLVCFGNVIGRTAYYQVEDTKHHTNLFGCLVGASSR